MNEELLASDLSTHIDAILAGQPALAEDSPEEVRQLIGLANQLAAIDLLPRPAFGQQLKQTLTDRQPRGHGRPGGASRLSGFVLLVMVALIGTIGMATLTIALSVTLLLSQGNPLQTSPLRTQTAVPLLTTETVPALSTPIPSMTPEATPTCVGTVQPTHASATDRLSPTATPLSAPPPPMSLSPLPGDAEGEDRHNQDDHSDDDDDDD